MDTECLRPLNGTLRQHQIILGRMGRDPEFAHSVPNAMMASTPGQIFWLLAISMAIEKALEYGDNADMLKAGPEKLTGPVLLKNAVNYYNSATQQQVRERSAWVLEQVASKSELSFGKIQLLPPVVWYPVDWNNHVHEMFRHEILAHRILLSPQKARCLFPSSDLVTYWTHSW